MQDSIFTLHPIRAEGSAYLEWVDTVTKNMMSEYIQQLEQLVGNDDFQAAEELCQRALRQGLDPTVWKTQMGYIYFLNEYDTEKYYNRAPAIFEELVKEEPTDPNAHFWLGYIYLILPQFDDEKADNEFYKVLEINPVHPYANLVLAGGLQGSESIEKLRKVLEVQPNNYRALKQLADLLLADEQYESARQALYLITRTPPYTEKDYGVMNRYINSVLTKSVQARALRREAQRLLLRILLLHPKGE